MTAQMRNDEAIDAHRMPFGDHLEELRHCLIRALVGVVVCTILALVFAKRILVFIMTPAVLVLAEQGEKPELLAMSPQGPFLLYLKVGILGGIVIASPWVLYQAWAFVRTGLYERERQFARRFMPISLGLFVGGVAFMYFIVLPIVLTFLVGFSQGFDLPDLEPSWIQSLTQSNDETDSNSSESANLTGEEFIVVPLVNKDPVDPPKGATWFNEQNGRLTVVGSQGRHEVDLQPAGRHRAVSSRYGIQDFVTFVFALALGFGLAFETPVLVVFLAVTGIVTTGEMAGARRYILFGIIVVAAILTPPDVISQVLLAVPMMILFESGLLVARRIERRREAS